MTPRPCPREPPHAGRALGPAEATGVVSGRPQHAALERPRELGLVRGIGVTTTRLRATRTIDSVTVALPGAPTGLGLAACSARALVRSRACRDGITPHPDSTSQSGPSA
jgi:hypothetical protein